MARGHASVGRVASRLRIAALLLLLSASAVLVPAQSTSPQSLTAGSLLVASRDLDDPGFAETVILLVHYDAENVVGLVLNRRSDVPLSRAFEGLRSAKDRSDPVYLGGPVDATSVFALLQSPARTAAGVEHIFGEVYMISSKNLLERTIASRTDPNSFHVYVGYAGWTNQQLRNEVELGAWFIFHADAGSVFDANPDSLWSRMIKKTEQKLAGNIKK